MRLPQTTFKFIYHFVCKQRGKFLLLTVMSVAWAINDSIFPYFLKAIVNTLQQTHAQNTFEVFGAVRGTLFMLILFWVLTEILQRAQGILQIYTFPEFRSQIREQVFNYVKKHSHSYFANNFSGNIAKKLSDLPNSSQMVIEIICFQFVTAATGSLVVLYMMYQTQPFFAGIVFIWLCIHLGLTYLFLSLGNYLWEEHSDSVAVLNGKIVDIFSNILNVRLFARANEEKKYIARYQNDEIQKSKKAMWAVELIRIGLGLNGLFLIIGLVLGLLYAWSNHWITLGDFTQVGMQAFWLLGWIWFVSYQITLFARETGIINNALSLVRKEHDLTDAPNASHIQIKKGEIEFRHVNFKYGEHRQIFKNLNVKIHKGEKIGLVGTSGSGKSTFVNLIMRFFDVDSGEILIDGMNIANVTQDSLRSQIAMIPQEPILFHRTLMENIRYGNLQATDEEVINAAKLAHCHDFIEKLDRGYQSLVGERGLKLSGGQRQRIAIARAILKDAPILILDEATSALDSVTEKLIQQSMLNLMQNRTTIVIAHRLSTLSDMDKILVFQKGQLVEEGPKENLLEFKGHFAKLWNMQKDGFLPQAV